MIGEIPIEKKYNLTLDEAAEYAGIDATRMRKISDEGEDLVIWIGRRRFIRRKALEEYIKEHYDELIVEEGEALLWQEDRQDVPISQILKMTAKGEIVIEQYLRPENIRDLIQGSIAFAGRTDSIRGIPYMRIH